ncbi:hypothetical protein ACHAXN_000174, partial [Cyclotella atomus]
MYLYKSERGLGFGSCFQTIERHVSPGGREKIMLVETLSRPSSPSTTPLLELVGTTQTKNFKYISGSQTSLSHCPSYDPSNSQQASAAWSDQGVCSGPLITPPPTPKPTTARWSGKGCPKKWVDGASYKGGEIAKVNGLVYKCFTAQAANTCWTKADVWSYDPGTHVSKAGSIYKCKALPYGLWCKVAAYEPDKNVYWGDAWAKAGDCVDLTSSSSPSFSPSVLPSNRPSTSILTASDEDAMHFFGYSVSVSGNTAVIRSSGDDNNEGSAYVFQHIDSNGWIQVAKLTASDGAV